MKKLLLFFLSFLSLPSCYGAQEVQLMHNSSVWTSLIKKCSGARTQIQSLFKQTSSRLAHTTWNAAIIKKIGTYGTIASVAVCGIYALSHKLLQHKKPAQPRASDTQHLDATQQSSQITTQDATKDTSLPTETTQQEKPVQEAVTIPVHLEHHDEHLPVVPYFSAPEHHVIQPIEFDNEHNHSHIIVQQLRVLSQDATDQYNHRIGGGNYSCGYHACTKNALALAGIVQGFDTAAVFNSPAIAAHLFDPVQKGYLRKHVIDMRKKVALKYLFQNSIHVVLPEPCLDKQENTKVIYTLYKCMVNEYLNNIISKAIETNKSVYISPLDILQDLQNMTFKVSDATAKEIACSPQDLHNFLHQQENIRRYIRVISPIEILQSTPINALHYYNATHANRLDEYGELLNSDEMEKLINYYCETDELARRVLDPHNVQTIIIESADPVMLDLMGSMQEIKDIIQSEQSLTNRRYIFILGNTNQKTQKNGHWVTLLLECAGHERRYTITNSSDNHICLFDDQEHNNPCFNVIKYLEGDCATHYLKPSTLYKDTLLAQLLSDMDQCKLHTKDPHCLENLQDSHTLYDTYVGDYSFHHEGREGFLHDLGQLIESCIS